MARKPELDLDPHLQIFDKDEERQTLQRRMSQLSPRREALQKQMSQLSPRRTTQDSSVAIMTLPFYEEISPSAALERMFRLFQTRRENREQNAEGNGEGASDEDAQQEEIGRDEFNRLRRCIGKPVVTEREWMRALEELGMADDKTHVRKRDFKALFGPPPFFGTPDVHDIIKNVMTADECIHFSQTLLSRFGAPADDDAPDDMVIGLEGIRSIQRGACLDTELSDADWKELLKKLLLPETQKHLDWMQFAESFHLPIKNKKIFGTLADPASVVYAVLANDKVLETIKDPSDNFVSRKAFTNLLRLKKTKMDDDKWMKLLETMQTRYQYRQPGEHIRSDDEDDSDDEQNDRLDNEQPLVVVRNTRNQVLSYEITFDEHGEVGLDLQSDFYGRCLTVAEIRGQAAKHKIIQKHDIVAAIDSVSLTYDRIALSKGEEQDRVNQGMSLLQGDRVRKITFHRQESYFQYEESAQTLHLFMKTLEEVPHDGKFLVQMPQGSSWGPISYEPGLETDCLRVQFDVPKHEELDLATVAWNPGSESIEITLQGEIAIEGNSTVVIQIAGLACGEQRLVGPCELSDGALTDAEGVSIPTHYVSLHTEWKQREATLQHNPVRERQYRTGKHFDESLKPLVHVFDPGESGLTLASDFFGQCVVVDKIKGFSQGAGFKVQQNDILTTIAVVGENESLDFVNCIKPFASNKSGANSHLSEVRKRLTQCHKSGQKYRLQFLRLNSYFFHDNGRTIFTLHARTTLRGGTTLFVKMPDTKWIVDGAVTASIADPVGTKVRETFWDSQKHTLQVVLDECTIAESTPVIVEIHGIVPGVRTRCAGPGEVTGLYAGVSTNPPEMEFELHEHWHSFLVGHQGLESSKVAETLKKFSTSPAMLWEELEYTSQLFDMYKPSDEEHLSLKDLNRLISIVSGEKEQMSTVDWNALCRNLGAKPLVGLTRRQFACSWYDVVGLSKTNAKDIYVRLHTAERIFKELASIYQEGDDQDILYEDTVERLAKFAGLSENVKQKALKDLKDQGSPGWDCDTFFQIVCGRHPIVKFDDNAMALWTRLYYSKLLFSTYSTKKIMGRKNLANLLAATRIAEPKLTNEKWTEICDSVNVDDSTGLQLADFLDVYADDLLGSRHAVADWHRIETFKLLPERRQKDNESKEATLSVAPERVDVKDIAAKALESTASTDELFQALLEKGLEFSKLEKIGERVATDFTFKTNLVAKRKSRARGFLNIQVKNITSLADHLLQQNALFNDRKATEELYIMFELTDARGLRYRLPDRKPKSRVARLKEALFGESDTAPEYIIKKDEIWDEDATQKLMRAMSDVEKQLAKTLPPNEHQKAIITLKQLQSQLTPRKAKIRHALEALEEQLENMDSKSPEYMSAVEKQKQLKELLSPKVPAKNAKKGEPASDILPMVEEFGNFDGHIFSSLVLRDQSPDAIVKFPDDHFRLFMDVPEDETAASQLYVVCKLFKRVGSMRSNCEVKLKAAQNRLNKTKGTLKVLQELVDQQEEHLRHVIADEHAKKNETMNNSHIWTVVSKLKQKRKDVMEFEATDVKKVQEEVNEMAKKLDEATKKELEALKLLQEEAMGVIPDAEPVTPGVVSPIFNKSELKQAEKKKRHLLEEFRKEREAQRIKFIGQASFEVDDLLAALHDDQKHTEDLAVFRTEENVDVGAVLLQFEYKCASLQEQEPARRLPSYLVSIPEDEGEDEDKDKDDDEKPQDNESKDEKKDAPEVSLVSQNAVEEEAFEFPSHSYLEVAWESGVLKEGDRLFLIREGSKYKLGMPYFFMLWSAFDEAGNPTAGGQGGVGDRESSDHSLCDWWIPDNLKESYLSGPDKFVRTEHSKREGVVLFPSSVELSLPPGVYRVYLIRNEVDKGGGKFRTVLGSTKALTVMPGVNGVHTSFGTTPLIDIKPLSASLEVFAASEQRGAKIETPEEQSSNDEMKLKWAEVEQEVEVVKRDLRMAERAYQRIKERKENKDGKEFERKKTSTATQAAEKKISLLKAALEKAETEKEKLKVMKKEALANAKPVSQKEAAQEKKAADSASAARQSAGLPSVEPVVFSYHFQGGNPTADDRILVLPADVVRVSDVLRSTILGKLQANDSQQVAKARATLERELKEVADFYNMRITFKQVKKVIVQFIKPASATTSDDSFVWAECIKAYKTATPIARKCFAYIIRDLLDEIAARKDQLGLEMPTDDDASSKNPSKARLSRLKKLLKIGKEIKVPLTAFTRGNSHTGASKNATNQEVWGHVVDTLGHSFRQGGFFVAKYVRRPAMISNPQVNAAAGELCRYGPFYVEPARISFNPRQVAFMLAKHAYKAATSDEGMAAMRVAGQFILAFLKYFLSVVSLSFNISVLAGNFHVDVSRLQALLNTFQQRLASYYGPFEYALTRLYDFFDGYIQLLLGKLDFFTVAGECMTGFVLWGVLAALFAATFIVYIVVQEDILLKLHKIHAILPFNPGKMVLAFFEHVGALLVIPTYLAIKSCVLFISANWSDMYHTLNDDPSSTLDKLKLRTTATTTCPNVHLAKINHGFGIAALVLITAFLFVCFPLLLLDVFSWVPLSELEDPNKLKELARSYKRLDIKAAVHSNANLITMPGLPTRAKKVLKGSSKRLAVVRHKLWRVYFTITPKPIRTFFSWIGWLLSCFIPRYAGFQTHYHDYTTKDFRTLFKLYGIIGLFCIFINIYAHLMLQSIKRSLGVLLGWRFRGEYMYKKKEMKPQRAWAFIDSFCLRFNFAWKLQYIKDKMVMPVVNVFMVTLGLWGESQWKEFNVEERANECFRMEPSGEIKQLQMMTLHGKIISLFWLCIPETMVLAYLAEVLNRGPVFSYFLNDQFLQADIPESEREKDPVWRFHSVMAFKGEDDVVYLSDTRFYSTLMKWGSSVVEIIFLLMVYGKQTQNNAVYFGITLISSAVTPILDLNQHLIKAYMEYVEVAENLAASTGLLEKLEKTKNVYDAAKEKVDAAKDFQENLPGVKVRMVPTGGSQPATLPNQQQPAPAPNQKVGALPDSPPPPVTNGNIQRAAAAVPPTPGQSTDAPGPTASVPPPPPPPVVGAPIPSVSMASKIEGMAASAIGAQGISLEIGSDDFDLEDALSEGVDAVQDGVDGAAAAALVAVGMSKLKKELILLNAMPEVSYVVLTDALEDGEGEITVSWHINARQRFHALDAIGMFPARTAGDTSVREMKDCICYRLLKDNEATPFGWKPRHENEDAERELVLRQAKSLRDIAVKEITDMTNASTKPHENSGYEDHEQRVERHQELLKQAGTTMNTMMHSPKLKPYKKKLPDILEEEVIQKKIASPRTSRVYSIAAAALEDAGKKARKIIDGQAKFRPVKNCVPEDDPEYEGFVYGNDAGIYLSKYGLHAYEFCYLRYNDLEKQVGISNEKDRANASKVTPVKTAPEKYEILERFVSNPVQIGTFNLFMNLTCDQPLVGARQKLNLSWTIYGVGYSTLSDPLCRNCVGFYKVDNTNTAACSRVEIIPTSAYLQAADSDPCAGRMMVTSPSEPGIYEIRFLFNFFKEAQLHRQCQVFGILEDEMQQLRIRSFYEHRALTEELRKFALREPKMWGVARMNTFAWLKAMLLSTIREPAPAATMESTTEFAKFLYVRLKKKLQQGLENPSSVYQRRISQMVAPLRLGSFIQVLAVALQSNSQVNDMMASVSFISPTEEDEQKRGRNPARDSLLLASDNELLRYGNISFCPLAASYLNRPSLCGYHDFVDDILLNHGQLILTVEQVMNNVSTSCVALYESAIVDAIAEMKVVAKELNLGTAMQGIYVILTDICRSHIQSIVRALLETDCRTGRRWPGRSEHMHDRIIALRAGTLPPEDEIFEIPAIYPQLPGGDAPLTRQYVALRRWIRPKLQRKIVNILKQRYARLLDGNMLILMEMSRACYRPRPSLVGVPFPDYRRMKTDSSLYFLAESRDEDGKPKPKEVTQDRSADNIEAMDDDDKEKEEEEEKEEEDEKQEEEKQEEEKEEEDKEDEGQDNEEGEGEGEEEEEEDDGGDE
ncbi:hypothetical protein Poli38472_002339 [Pythium oligandrum]|uniref:PDZ domain-containing protein n=1 Tax=Pythium oligandrum TaxID=41045 RepID=A0A8K1CJ44_PYTOL|nr:hypothetical protein Poli38472_002339 [Pythium oligandrum]|eukprot:TMW63398.1 hypothetical protein Poli38472_002339 [Pythium oligandrum]